MKKQKSALWFLVFYFVLYLMGAAFLYFKNGHFIYINEDGDPNNAFSLAFIPVFLFFCILLFAAISRLSFFVLICSGVPAGYVLLYGGLQAAPLLISVFPVLIVLVLSFQFGRPDNWRYGNLSIRQRCDSGYQYLHVVSKNSVTLFYANLRELCGIRDDSVSGVLIEKIHEIADEMNEAIISDMSYVASFLENVIRRDRSTITKMLTQGNRSIEDVALALIRNRLRELLLTGNFFIYRGVLDLQGQGFMSAYNFIVDRLCDRGYISVLQKEEDLSWLQSELKNAG